MRVSKTVREYIEKQVASKFPKTKSELEHEQLTNLINSANEDYEKLMEQAKEKIVAELLVKYNLPQDTVGTNRYSYHQFSTWGTKIKTKRETDRVARNVAMRQKVEDIIVTLELGGTKADLEKMLAEI